MNLHFVILFHEPWEFFLDRRDLVLTGSHLVEAFYQLLFGGL